MFDFACLWKIIRMNMWKRNCEWRIANGNIIKTEYIHAHHPIDYDLIIIQCNSFNKCRYSKQWNTISTINKIKFLPCILAQMETNNNSNKKQYVCYRHRYYFVNEMEKNWTDCFHFRFMHSIRFIFHSTQWALGLVNYMNFECTHMSC